MPFASCFVCLEKGHLASKCPQNAAKGIYPDGGCCGLCKGTDHLSRDCELRKNGSSFGVLLHALFSADPFWTISSLQTA